MECHKGQLTGGSEKGNGALHIGSWERLHDKLVDLTLADSVLRMRGLRYGIGIAAEAWWLRYFVPSQSTYLVWGVVRGSFHHALVSKYCNLRFMVRLFCTGMPGSITKQKRTALRWESHSNSYQESETGATF